MPSQRRHCDGYSRRDLLKSGAATAFGLPFTLPQMLATEARIDPAARQDVSFIYVFLRGGLSTIATFDLKPDAPDTLRGPFEKAAAH